VGILKKKDDQDLDETESLASPEIEEATKFDPLAPQLDEELKKLAENSADEIKISYDSDEHEPSERTHQESEEPCERNDGEEMQQLEISDVNHHGDSEESATSPRSVLPDMSPLDQTHSEDPDLTSDGQLRNVDPPAESSHNQLDEHSEPTEETTVETVCLDATGPILDSQEGSEETFNAESKSAEDHKPLFIDPSPEELKGNQTDAGRS
jgi:hypothetical protein